VQSSSQIITNNKPTPTLYTLDALPVAQLTVSTVIALKGTEITKTLLNQISHGWVTSYRDPAETGQVYSNTKPRHPEPTRGIQSTVNR